MTNDTPQKEMASTVSAVEAIKEKQKPTQFSAKSTATQAQHERIVKMLRISTRSTFDFRKDGIMAPAARIKELNEKHGFRIIRIALRDLWDDEGFMHPRVAIYALIDEPR